MTNISIPITSEVVSTMLKPGEKIVCTNAIVTMDARGELSWWDKDKYINILCEEKEGVGNDQVPKGLLG